MTSLTRPAYVPDRHLDQTHTGFRDALKKMSFAGLSCKLVTTPLSCSSTSSPDLQVEEKDEATPCPKGRDVDGVVRVREAQIPAYNAQVILRRGCIVENICGPHQFLDYHEIAERYLSIHHSVSRESGTIQSEVMCDELRRSKDLRLVVEKMELTLRRQDFEL